MKTIDRNNKIISLFISGETGSAIGEYFNISRERVRQILKRNGISSVDGGAAIKSKVRKEEIRKNYLNKWMSVPRCTKEFWINTPVATKRAYTQHRFNSKRRNIPFHISLPEWVEVWEDSGKYGMWGKEIGKYVMSRYGDKGAYEIGNVNIVTTSHNHSDAYKYKRWNPAKNRIIKTHCHKGHVKTGITTSGHKYCKICMEDSNSRSREKKRLALKKNMC